MSFHHYAMYFVTSIDNGLRRAISNELFFPNMMLKSMITSIDSSRDLNKYIMFVVFSHVTKVCNIFDDKSFKMNKSIIDECAVGHY